ncbi:hypothetical protein PMAYCL1PPCAC_12675, partial [Pristionchus mayeri]
ANQSAMKLLFLLPTLLFSSTAYLIPCKGNFDCEPYLVCARLFGVDQCTISLFSPRLKISQSGYKQDVKDPSDIVDIGYGGMGSGVDKTDTNEIGRETETKKKLIMIGPITIEPAKKKEEEKKMKSVVDQEAIEKKEEKIPSIIDREVEEKKEKKIVVEESMDEPVKEVEKVSIKSEDEELLSVLGEKEIKWEEGVGRGCEFDYQCRVGESCTGMSRVGQNPQRICEREKRGRKRQCIVHSDCIRGTRCMREGVSSIFVCNKEAKEEEHICRYDYECSYGEKCSDIDGSMNFRCRADRIFRRCRQDVDCPYGQICRHILVEKMCVTLPNYFTFSLL